MYVIKASEVNSKYIYVGLRDDGARKSYNLLYWASLEEAYRFKHKYEGRIILSRIRDHYITLTPEDFVILKWEEAAAIEALEL